MIVIYLQVIYLQIVIYLQVIYLTCFSYPFTACRGGVKLPAEIQTSEVLQQVFIEGKDISALYNLLSFLMSDKITIMPDSINGRIVQKGKIMQISVFYVAQRKNFIITFYAEYTPSWHNFIKSLPSYNVFGQEENLYNYGLDLMSCDK